MSEILQYNQLVDLPPPRFGRNFLGRMKRHENPIFQGALATRLMLRDDVSTQNDSATRRVNTGKIRGICSAPVHPSRSLGRLAALLCVGIILTGCEDRETARARNEQRLPVGCKIIDMDYGDLTAAVICDGRKTQTSARAWDETVMIYDANLKMMTPYTTHYRQITAQIGDRP